MGHRVGRAAEDPGCAPHPPAPDHDEVGPLCFCHLDDHVARLADAAVALGGDPTTSQTSGELFKHLTPCLARISLVDGRDETGGQRGAVHLGLDDGHQVEGALPALGQFGGGLHCPQRGFTPVGTNHDRLVHRASWRAVRRRRLRR